MPASLQPLLNCKCALAFVYALMWEKSQTGINGDNTGDEGIYSNEVTQA